MLITVHDADSPKLNPVVLGTVEMEIVPRNGEYIRIDDVNYAVTGAAYEVKRRLPRRGGGLVHSDTIVWVARRYGQR